MRCERKNSRAAERAGADATMPGWWHRLWCDRCRGIHQVDCMVERGCSQIRSEPPPSDSLTKTLMAAGCSANAFSAETRRATNSALSRALALVGVGIFVTTLAQPEKIGSSLFGAQQSPGASAQGVAGFWALLGLFWYLKPLAALLLESVPALISRRGLFLICSAMAAALLWTLSCLLTHAPRPFAPILGMAVNAMLAIASTILGGYLVEQAHRIGASGRLGALHQAATHLAGMAAPIFGLAVGGAMAPLRVAPLIAAALLALFGVVAATVLPKKAASASLSPPESATAQLQSIARARGLWQVAILFLLVVGVSSFDALLARQQVRSGLVLDQREHLSVIAHAATLVSIAAYAVLCRRTRLRSLLPAGILANMVGTLLYLAYAGPISFPAAAVIEVINGLAAALIIVTLFDLAVRAVPRQCPYLGYAILMSVLSLARALSEVVTSSLPLQFPAVILLSAVSSALGLLVVARLPSALMSRREGEPSPGSLPLLSRG